MHQMLAQLDWSVEIHVLEWEGVGEQWRPILVHREEVGWGHHISTPRVSHEMIHTSLESWLSWLHGAYRVLCI